MLKVLTLAEGVEVGLDENRCLIHILQTGINRVLVLSLCNQSIIRHRQCVVDAATRGTGGREAGGYLKRQNWCKKA
jgi:hypothetical protein